MKPHTTSLALVAVPASAARPSAAETAARVCGLALDSYPPRLVAQRLGCSTDLVTGWGRSKSSPSLVQVFASPERFALRLLALAEVDRELLRRAGVVTKPGEDKGAR